MKQGLRGAALPASRRLALEAAGVFASVIGFLLKQAVNPVLAPRLNPHPHHASNA